MYLVSEKRAEKREKLEQATRLLDNAEKAGRQLTPTESRRYDNLLAEIDNLQYDIDHADDIAPGQTAIKPGVDRGYGSVMDGDVRLWNPTDEIPSGDFHIGKVIRAMVEPKFRKDLNDNEQRALVTGVDSKGGVTVPEDFSGDVIAPLRANTVIAKNMKFVEMPHLNKTLVGIDSDDTSTIDGAAETASLPELDISFHAVELKAVKMGGYVKISEELMYASNAADMIKDSLLFSAGNRLDYFIIHGTGANQPEGLENTAGIYSNTAIGALTFGTLSTEIFDLRGNNAPGPYQCFYATNVGGFLDSVQDATTKRYASDDWLPKSWRDMQKHESGVLEDGYLVFGSFRTHGVVAMGGGWRIELSNAASDSATNGFTDGVIFARVMGFADVAFLQPGAFQVLTGITSISDLA